MLSLILKQNRKKEKKMQRKEGAYFQALALPFFIFGFWFWTLVSTFSFQALSSWHLLKQKKKDKKTQRKNHI
jgi:hypothetical protein